jgi:probable HAF family extracellular repeat protein
LVEHALRGNSRGAASLLALRFSGGEVATSLPGCGALSAGRSCFACLKEPRMIRRPMESRTVWLLLFVAALGFAILAAIGNGPALAQKGGGKPGGGGGGGGSEPPPPPPPAPDFHYEFVWIHDEESHRWSEVKDFNHAGEVLGHAGVLGLDGNPVTRCYLWSEDIGLDYLDELSTVNEDGEPLAQRRHFNPDWPDIGDAKEFAFTDVEGLNDFGQVVGNGYYLDGWPEVPAQRTAFRWTPSDDGPALLEHIDVPTAWGSSTSPKAVNNSGDVSGMFSVSGQGWHIFVLTEEDGFVNLGKPNMSPSPRTQILSDRYEDGSGGVRIQLVVSAYDRGTQGGSRVFRYTATVGSIAGSVVVEDLGTMRSDNSGWAGAGGMNSLGEIAGQAAAPGKRNDDFYSAFLHTDAMGMIDLGTLSTNSTKTSWAYDINDWSEVVGISHDGTGNIWPVLWLPDLGIVNLELLVDHVPYDALDRYYFRGFWINNTGDVVGPLVSNYNFSGWAHPPKAFLLRREMNP